MELTDEQLQAFSKLCDDYKNITAYRQRIKVLNYVQFDYDVSHEMTLFMTDPNFSFEELEERIGVILDALPAIKRIFAQPFIHLKERDEILPVESVRIVNNNTLRHIAAHSELWTDVKDNEIKPEKLMSRIYEDNYGIYENLVFCNVVDDILAFTRTNIRFLKELIYANQTIEINLLERVNHLNYFLALGKLHIGYSKSFDKYYAVSKRCLNKLQFIENSIVPRLKRPVYKNNKSRPANLKIHKTNILSMHKEYHRIYKLAKSSARRKEQTAAAITARDIAELVKSYYFFCRIMCIFAVGHFNFACDSRKLFSLHKINIDFTFKDWTLKLSDGECAKTQFLSIEVNKDKPYRVILLPSVEKDSTSALEAVKANVQADEYIVCTPFGGAKKDKIFVDISSIESFRRLQQVVLRAMIYADTERKECPFCNHKLTLNEEKSAAGNPVYECVSCRTEIREGACPDAGKNYFYTKISDLAMPLYEDDDDWLRERKSEAKMYFRNITSLDEDANTVCPHCGKVHIS